MIRKFEIYNDKYKEVQGYLYLNTDTERWSIVLPDNYDGMTPDITFKLFKEMHPGENIMAEHMVESYLRHRIFPPERHNASELLSAFGLKEWNLMQLILKTHGYSDMDPSYFREVKLNKNDVFDKNILNKN